MFKLMNLAVFILASSSPLLAGQVAVINPSIGFSVTAPAAVAVSAPTPSVSGGASTSISGNGNVVQEDYALQTNTANKAIMKILTELNRIQIDSFEDNEIRNLADLLDTILSENTFDSQIINMLMIEKQRLTSNID